MPHVYISAVIPAALTKVWPIIRDFNALPEWHPAIAISQIEDGLSASQVGCVRHFELQDGGVIREQLLALSDMRHRCSYSILESPLGVENYKATLQLTRVTESDACFAEWWADFDCAPDREAELVDLIGRDVFAAGFAALTARV